MISEAPPGAGAPGGGEPFPFREVLLSGVFAFVLVALAGQLIPIVIDLVGGGLAVSTALKLGWFYTLAFHHVGIEVTGAVGAAQGAVLPVDVRLSAAFLLGTALAIWVVYRAGRAMGRRQGGSVGARAFAGASVAFGYAVPFLLLSLVVKLQLATTGGPLPTSIDMRGVAWQALVFPLVLAALAGGAGGLRSAPPRGERGRAALSGGWVMFVAGCGLALVGILLLAAVRPAGLAAYVHGITAHGSRISLLLLGHHVLLLPNQSVFVLAPSMLACTSLHGPAADVSLLCPGTLPALNFRALLGDLAAALGGARPGVASDALARPMPFQYAAFLLVPAVASVWGGRVAATQAARGRLVTAACSGVVFATLMGAAAWMSSISLTIRGTHGLPRTFTVGPRPAMTTLAALAWGVGGGVVGALLAPQDQTPEPEPGPGLDPGLTSVAEEPEPPRPTSV